MTDEKPTSWWATLPGLLTAAAGVITALTGLLAILVQLGIIGGPTPSAGPGVPSTSNSATGSPAPTLTEADPTNPEKASAPPDNSLNADVKWSGPILESGRMYVKPAQGRAGEDFVVGGRGFLPGYIFGIRHQAIGPNYAEVDPNGSFSLTLSTEPALCTEYKIELVVRGSPQNVFGTTSYTTTGC